MSLCINAFVSDDNTILPYKTSSVSNGGQRDSFMKLSKGNLNWLVLYDLKLIVMEEENDGIATTTMMMNNRKEEDTKHI